VNNSGALWKIPTENSFCDSLYNWHDEQCSQFTNEFTDGIYSVGNSVGKNNTLLLFFLLCFNFVSHGNSLGIYRGNIFIGKISQKFTNKNIPSIFLFIVIDFLVVIEFLDAWSPYGLSIVIQATCIMGTMTGFASLPVFIILLGCLQPQIRITWSPFPHDSRLRRSPMAPNGQQLVEL